MIRLRTDPLAAPSWGRLALVTGLLLAPPVTAREPLLNQPIDCTLGVDCYIQSFVDHDDAPAASQDFQCGVASRDDHRGTDFALPTIAAMKAGVDVVAAAPGVVRGTRDGVRDAIYGSEGAPNIDGRECGNGVAIDHGSGWSTQYCHLAEGSVAVKTGARVAKGAVLGKVGLSGKTTFPHLHLDVRHHGKIVDPFDPQGAETCGPADRDLWQVDLPYAPGGLIRIGVAPSAPDYDAVKDGAYSATRLSRRAPALILWAHLFHGQPGDQVQMDMSGPNRFVLSTTQELTRAQEQLMRFSGRKLRGDAWAEGTYQGTVTLLRNGTALDTASLSFTLE